MLHLRDMYVLVLNIPKNPLRYFFRTLFIVPDRNDARLSLSAMFPASLSVSCPSTGGRAMPDRRNRRASLDLGRTVTVTLVTVTVVMAIY